MWVLNKSVSRSYWIAVALLMAVSSAVANSETENLPLSFSIPSELCDYEGFVDAGSSEKERVEREDLYLTLLGMLEELSIYRNQFLIDGKWINLFPTAYYNTTMLEMKDIIRNDFQHPVEKMKQMLAFYDAYKYNRILWN